MVATAHKVNDKEYHKKNYYKEGSEGEKNLNQGLSEGQWWGVSARSLGLSNEIEWSEYDNLMEGFSPKGDLALVQNAGSNHVSACDVTFSPHKSVSILHVLDKKGVILFAHEQAVKASLRLIENKAAYTRRGAQGKEAERLPGVLAALFTHFESRAEDMQIHTHSVILNLAQRHDLTWGTIESKYLFRWVKAAGATYRAELAQNLRELGYEIEAWGESFKVQGVPISLCDSNSKRSRQINKSLNKFGVKSSASSIGDKIVTYTRQKKSQATYSELNEGWQESLHEENFSYEEASLIRNDGPTMAMEIIDAEMVLAELTATKSTFREQDLFYYVAVKAQMSGDRVQSIQQISEQALSSAQTIKLRLDPKGNQLYTTREVIGTEREMVSLAKELKNSYFRAPDVATINEAVKKKEQACGYELTDEQAEALRLTCSSDQITILQGSAGAGKSASMEALRFACERIDQVVVGACIAKIAVDNLQAETGIPSRTIAKLIYDYEQGKKPLANADVLLIDEAGQVGCKQMLTLLSMAKASHTKVVLVGEDKQLDAIERGGVLGYLSRPEVIGTARVEKIQRQNTQWARQAVTDFRDGNALAALKALNTHNLLDFSSSFDDAVSALINKWEVFTEQSDKKSVVLAQRWKEVNALSERLRNIYQDRGQVQHQNIEFECSVSNKSMSLPFSVGERVRFSKNDYKLGVSNGTLGTLKSLEFINSQWQFSVEFDSGERISFGQDQYIDEFGRLPLVHSYAMTVYSSQGVTVDGDTFILYNQSMDRANCYVAGSRHKDNSHFFINKNDINHLYLTTNETSNDIERLASLMSRVSKSDLAMDLLSQNQLSELEADFKEPEIENLKIDII